MEGLAPHRYVFLERNLPRDRRALLRLLHEGHGDLGVGIKGLQQELELVLVPLRGIGSKPLRKKNSGRITGGIAGCPLAASSRLACVSVQREPGVILFHFERIKMRLDLDSIRSPRGPLAVARLAVTDCLGYSPRVRRLASAVGKLAGLDHPADTIEDLE